MFWFEFLLAYSCTDGFFAAQVYVSGNIVYWYLFYICVFFIIFPLLLHSVQIHHEIEKWMNDTETSQIVSAWIYSYLKWLYGICIACASSYSAVQLCNSNLFDLNIFNMGLNRRQLALFKYVRTQKNA